MKKYDFALLALYAVVITLAYGANRYIYHQEQNLRAEVKQIVDNQAVTKVVIRDVYSEMKIFYTDKEDKDVWGLRGWINQSHVDGLHIDDGVLYIHDFESNSLRYMKIKEGIPIEIEHSPKVQMLSREEVEAIKKRNKKQRWQYEF